MYQYILENLVEDLIYGLLESVFLWIVLPGVCIVVCTVAQWRLSRWGLPSALLLPVETGLVLLSAAYCFQHVQGRYLIEAMGYLFCACGALLGTLAGWAVGVLIAFTERGRKERRRDA